MATIGQLLPLFPKLKFWWFWFYSSAKLTIQSYFTERWKITHAWIQLKIVFVQFDWVVELRMSCFFWFPFNLYMVSFLFKQFPWFLFYILFFSLYFFFSLSFYFSVVPFSMLFQYNSQFLTSLFIRELF